MTLLFIYSWNHHSYHTYSLVCFNNVTSGFIVHTASVRELIIKLASIIRALGSADILIVFNIYVFNVIVYIMQKNIIL